MNAGDLVVIHCGGPREKFWGVLLELAPAGATARVVPVDAFEDWLRQCASKGPRLLGPVTVFLPAHRIERIELDETAGVAEALGARFERATGRDPRRALAGEAWSGEEN